MKLYICDILLKISIYSSKTKKGLQLSIRVDGVGKSDSIERRIDALLAWFPIWQSDRITPVLSFKWQSTWDEKTVQI